MATTTVSAAESRYRFFIKPLSTFATAGMLVLVGMAITVQVPAATPLAAVAAAAVLGVTGWMFLSERYEWSLALLMLYLGLADGYLKLKTGSSQATLVRDVFLYAIAAGALIRIAIRREVCEWPPLTGWVVAWLLVVAVQVANPADGTLMHSLASVRPHAEWVPLFFLGWAVMRSRAKLRVFFLLLLAITAVNGAVGLIQLGLTPEQLADWGPGYERAINGEGDVSGRSFVDRSGTARTRPFGLGSDFGFGGALGLIAVPGALALLALSHRPGVRAASALLAIGAILAIATSQARVSVLGGVVAVFAFAALSVASRAGLRTVLAVGAVLGVAYFTAGVLSSGAEQGSFDHYESISTPAQALDTAYQYRRETLAEIPSYARDFPLGAGIGSKGPAASIAGGGAASGLSAESEPTYLLIELGIPGLAVMLGFNLALLWTSVVRIRRIRDRETRILLTAMAAPLFAIFATWFVGTATATTPSSPYLWFAAGVLSYWLLGDGRRAEAPRPTSIQTPRARVFAGQP